MTHKLGQSKDVSEKTFDFIVVGGGTAGLCVANRLSEASHVSVLVLEAGRAHINDDAILNPIGWVKQFLNDEYDWKFPTVPQPTLDNASLIWSRGKGLGGSSAMNLLIWTRPQRQDIDAVEKVGNPGWNWENFYKFSKKSERFSPPVNPSSRGYQDLYNANSVGLEGPIPISFARSHSGAEFPLQKSLEALGVPTINDSLSGDTLGTYKAVSDINAETGARSYSGAAYLLPALDRPNLTVVSEASVTRVITEQQGNELVATGVEFSHGETIYKVYAAKDVILSAGTIKSPQILELSGIGDRAILQPLGIPVRKHLPTVGANLQDHLICTGMSFDMREDANIVTSDLILDPKHESRLRAEFPDVKGPLSVCLTGVTFLPLQTFSTRSQEIIEKMATRIARDAAKYPPGLKEQYEVQMQILKDSQVPDIEIVVFPFKWGNDDSNKPFMLLMPSIGHPFSRGTIHIKSADPKEPPVIDPHYFEEDVDFDILVDGWKFTREVAATGPFKDITVAESIPGPSVQTDEEIKAHIKKNLSTTWHACGSVSMLPQDKGGVVDTHLKVYGTKNLRVIDLSILPLLVAVHTQATVYGIAEMGADIVKNDHGLV